MKTAILIMAAGFSSRFRLAGGDHKLLAQLNGKAVLQHTIENALASGLDVAVVVRPNDCHLHPLLAGTQPVFCASNGLSDSIAAGVQACPDYDGWLIALGDMPFLTPVSYQAVSKALQQSPLVRPQVNGIPGHPVGFQRQFASALCSLQGDTGAQVLLKTFPPKIITLADNGCLQDVDHPDDLHRIKENR